MEAFETIFNRDAHFRWKPAAGAGLIAGAITWLLSHGTPWFTSGLVSPTLMGRDLKAPGLVDPVASLVTVLALLLVSIAYGLVIGAIVSRVRALWGVVTGALIGLGLYLLNFAVFHIFLGVNWSDGEWSVIVTHLVFGLVAAGAYKGLAPSRGLPQAPGQQHS